MEADPMITTVGCTVALPTPQTVRESEICKCT